MHGAEHVNCTASTVIMNYVSLFCLNAYRGTFEATVAEDPQAGLNWPLFSPEQDSTEEIKHEKNHAEGMYVVRSLGAALHTESQHTAAAAASAAGVAATATATAAAQLPLLFGFCLRARETNLQSTTANKHRKQYSPRAAPSLPLS